MENQNNKQILIEIEKHRNNYEFMLTQKEIIDLIIKINIINNGDFYKRYIKFLEYKLSLYKQLNALKEEYARKFEPSNFINQYIIDAYDSSIKDKEKELRSNKYK